MAKKVTGPRVLTANLLREGVSVFLGADGEWVRALAEARVARDDAEAEALEEEGAKAVRETLVVDPYLIAVEETEDGPVAVAHRERRRSGLGPTIAYGPRAKPNGRDVHAG